jgi:hypothetical protein
MRRSLNRPRRHCHARLGVEESLVENYELSRRLMLEMLTEDETNPAVRDILTADR